MHQIQLDDELFQEAQRRAIAAGFESVDAYVAEVLQHDFEDDENFDRFFTPERLAHIDRAAAQIDAGEGLASEQVREHFLRKRMA